MSRSPDAKSLCALALALCLLPLAACARRENGGFACEYGVFLSHEGDLAALEAYRTVVIDAQYVSAEDVAAFRARGHTVYSYLNVGSLESFRDYYDAYRDLALGAYEHWDEEVWIDAGSGAWQTFILQTLAPRLLEKGVDGFFVDNCDVYYHYPRQDIFDGLTRIVKGLRASGARVVINGGDAYLTAYCADGARASDVADGVNQESVFTSVDWDAGSFGRASAEDRAYFTDYVERCAAQGLEVFLLEYTTDAALMREIDEYCALHGFRYYVSGSLELGADAGAAA